MNWLELGSFLGFVSTIISVILILLLYRGLKLLQNPPEIDVNAAVKTFMKEDPARVLQIKSVEARYTNEANKKISQNLLENSPISALLNWLDDDTIEYLEEHPESLPGVLKKWVPILTAAKPFVDMLLEKLEQQNPDVAATEVYNL